MIVVKKRHEMKELKKKNFKQIELNSCWHFIVCDTGIFSIFFLNEQKKERNRYESRWNFIIRFVRSIVQREWKQHPISRSPVAVSVLWTDRNCLVNKYRCSITNTAYLVCFCFLIFLAASKKTMFSLSLFQHKNVRMRNATKEINLDLKLNVWD